MEGFSALRPTSAPRLMALGSITAAMVLSTMAAAPAADEKAATATRTTSTRLAVPNVESAPHLWTPSSNARSRRVVLSNGTTLGTVTPKRRGGHKTISLRSSQSRTTVAKAGTTVRAKARLKAGQGGRRITLSMLEVNRGRVVKSRSTSVVAARQSWRTFEVTLRTTQPDSRLVFVAEAKRISKRHSLRVMPVAVDITTTTGQPPVIPPAGSCESIDYSQPDQGILTFSDDFNGTTIDRTKWRVRDKTFLNQDQAYIRKENVTVSGGKLDIMGKRMDRDDWKTNTQSTYERNRTRDYSTGYIDTIDTAGYGNAAGDRFGQKYGYFEVTAMVPSEATMSRGIWPAFWLRADHKLGEIDPMESYGGPTIRNYNPSPSYEWNSWADTSQKSTKAHTQGTAHPKHDNVPIWKDYHRYGVNWSPTCLRYMFDGQTVGVVPLSSKPYFTGDSFNDTFHLRINLQIGTNYWGWADPDHTRSEFHYRVDSVKVFQAKELVPAR